MFLNYFCTFLKICEIIQFLCLRLQQHSIERAIDLTDSFTWEDLPTRDADTGYMTAAGWIPRIKLFSTTISIATISFHSIQSTIRIVTNHETMLTAWYPFDWTVSPFYEVVNISQVTHIPSFKKIKNYSNCSCNNFNLTVNVTNNFLSFLFLNTAVGENLERMFSEALLN